MPTRRGWALGLSSLAVGVGGRALGVPELFVVAVAGLALAAAAVVHVQVWRPTLEASRRLAPGRVTAGGTVRVVLTVANRGRRTPPLRLDDGEVVAFDRPSMPAGDVVGHEYRLDAPRRGLVAVGPLRVTVEDPFGLAARRVPVLVPSTLVVHPVVESITLPPEPAGASTASRPASAPVPGGEFHGLRPYAPGDDVRLIHWPTSARLDALVVRQDEMPQLRRTVIALDARAGAHRGSTFEDAVSVAASVVAAACAGEGTVRLVTSAGLDSGRAGGDAHVEEVLDLLAALERDPGSGVDPMASLLTGEELATLVVVTTAARGAGGLRALGAAAADAATSVVVVLAAPPGVAVVPGAEFDVVVPVSPGASWRDAWERVVPGRAGDR